MHKAITTAVLSIFVTGFAGYILFTQESRNTLSPEIPKNPDRTVQRQSIELSAISPIPLSIKTEADKVKLGQQLFFDTKLSADQSVSCASCHALNLGGTDGLPTAVGIHNQAGALNTPTVFNAFFNISHNWDGRAPSLSEQAKGPLFNPIEMGNKNEELLLSYLKKQYLPQFNALYSDGITLNNLVDAIAEFEKTLITPNSRFDQYLKGDTQVLNAAEIIGYQLFHDLGCIACHNGVNLGSNLYQRADVFSNEILQRQPEQAPDRFKITHNPNEKGFMKVPTLRNIALTAPYFHNGSASTLESAIKTMGTSQLGRNLAPIEVEYLVAFLHTLTGEYNNRPLKLNQN